MRRTFEKFLLAKLPEKLPCDERPEFISESKEEQRAAAEDCLGCEARLPCLCLAIGEESVAAVYGGFTATQLSKLDGFVGLRNSTQAIRSAFWAKQRELREARNLPKLRRPGTRSLAEHAEDREKRWRRKFMAANS